MEAKERRQRLVEMASRADDEIELAEGLLLSVAYANPALEIEPTLAALDALAEQARPRLDGLETPRERVEVLCEFLATDCGFQGDEQEYYDPRNSYLDEVLARRKGIPISLSVVYIEVARRVGITLRGVSFPFHFLLSAPAVEDLYIDPFHDGEHLSASDCKELLAQYSDGRIEMQPRFLAPASSRDVLLRVMRNLRRIHVKHAEWPQALACIDTMLIWDPELEQERRDRGLLLARSGAWEAAILDFEAYLAARPDAPDRARIELELMNARARRLEIN